MLVVIDTNVLLSGLLWHGTPHTLIAKARSGMLSLASSPKLLAELADVLSRPKFDAILTRSNTSKTLLLDEIGQLVEVTDPPPLPKQVCRDPDDDEVLALALAVRVDMIVSGDNDLRSLGSFLGIPIVDATTALAIINSS